MNYSTMPTGLPTPNGAIKKLPVVIRDRIPHVSMPAADIRKRAVALLAEYQKDLVAIANATEIEDAKYYADKADALAAWAKTYKNEELATAARREKLLAFRCMGELAESIANERNHATVEQKRIEAAALVARLREEAEKNKAAGNFEVADKLRRKAKDISRTDKPLIGSCRLPTGHSVLVKEHGMKPGEAIKIMNVARTPKKAHDRLVANAATVSKAVREGRGFGHVPKRSSDEWMWLGYTPGLGLLSVWSKIKKRNPHEVASAITKGEVKQARSLATELIEWLDAFEQALPK